MGMLRGTLASRVVEVYLDFVSQNLGVNNSFLDELFGVKLGSSILWKIVFGFVAGLLETDGGMVQLYSTN